MEGAGKRGKLNAMNKMNKSTAGVLQEHSKSTAGVQQEYSRMKTGWEHYTFDCSDPLLHCGQVNHPPPPGHGALPQAAQPQRKVKSN